MRTGKDKTLHIVPAGIGETTGVAFLGAGKYPCALGGSGIVFQVQKTEGDGATPAGLYWPEKVFYRPDHEKEPKTRLPVQYLKKNSGWCEDPGNPDYNKRVDLPHPAAAESMWRDDHLYDLGLVISHNRYPVRPGKGSAIFFHLARAGQTPTRGCVALSRDDFVEILKDIGPETLIRIHPGG